MPTLTRWFLKASLVYLILALCAGILLALPGNTLIPGLFPVYIHTLAFGWLTQLIFGVASWMFPKFSSAKPHGHEWLGWATFVLLNAGLVLRVIFEPLHSKTPTTFSGWILVGSALLQWLAGLAFVANTWSRVRER
ncbi:MAG: hypothetical protein QY328_00740 [Anaerolineales bacterium]|nr:hypothetical protein [Anaerolineales bacterium]WKZ40563.1 MAG: hypothetical protein QY328_00740 [Anaerolineales bacterium]